jgi:hypothetical protein
MTRRDHRRLANRVEWHLTSHFFRAMFDFGIFTPDGADSFTRMLLGGVGALIAFGLLLTRMYGGKYAALSAAGSSESYRIALLGDDLFLVGLPMLLVALLTLLVSHSLFPDERDFRILGPLPLSRSVIFAAKLTALLLFTGLVIALVHLALLPLAALTSFNRFREHAVVLRLAAWIVVSMTASFFAVLAIAALVGIITLTLSRSRLHALTALSRSVMLATLVVCVPFTFHLPGMGQGLARGARSLLFVPPAWFVGLDRALLGSGDPWMLQLAGVAVAGVALSAFTVTAVYVVLFKQVERLLLRPPSAAPSRLERHANRTGRVMPTRSNEGGAAPGGPSPAFRAVWCFTTTTIRRSQLHQGVLIGLSACGIALIANSLTGTNLTGRLGESGPPGAPLVSAAVWIPFALMFVCGIAVRAALALPTEHGANWIFRMTEDQLARRDQMRAVNRLVTACLVGMPVLATAPVLWLTFGRSAAIALAVVGLVGFVFVHAVLLDWRRIPFTCSYLPGKRLIAHTLVLGFAAFVLFTTTGMLLVYAAQASIAFAAAISVSLFVVGWALKRRRLTLWTETPLIFDDDFPDRLLQLGL